MRSPRLRAANPKAAMQSDMRAEQHAHSFLGRHLNWLRDQDPAISESLTVDLVECFTTDQGLRVLKLFEKSVLHYAAPDGSSDSALREINAVRNFVLEIRRLVGNG